MDCFTAFSTKKKVSIVIPSYNESENLKEMIPKLARILEDLSIKGEIIVVNDGSEDETDQVCDEILSRWHRWGYDDSNLSFKVLRHEVNLGKTQALSTGFYNAKGDYLFLLEADMQYNPRDIIRFIPLLDIGYDIVCGWRRHRADPPHRILLSKIQNIIQRIIFGTNINDHNVGFIGYRREVARILFNPNFIKELGLGRAHHRTVLALARYLGFTIDEVPVRHYSRRWGKSKVEGYKAIIETVKAFIKLYITLTFKREKIFSVYSKVIKELGGYGDNLNTS